MEGKYSCILVDDDRMSLKILEILVAKTTFLEIAGVFDHPMEAFKMLSEKKVDILFLDIEMPEMNGLELLETLIEKPQIIMTTYNNSYAVPAFDYEVADFLLKPIVNYSRFLKAVNKALKNLEHANRKAVNFDNEQIFVKIDSLLMNFNLRDILYIEAFGDYVKIHTNDKMYITHAKLKTVEETLPHNAFSRVHRSFIVRLDKIDNIDLSNLEIAKRVIPISNSYRSNLMDKINLLI
ncbi:response regulator transcription factor [Litoribacter alkaliphilus]|uniref:Response regulator transcription factor n=1 Tax=Litoribacter ruber TaxID=702568 RepID=A0AAP2G5G5_9BACT|nr:LytTR family DNA-binding domain-containing protein [Litoribacter alkaliphilus]MBS9524513.1 response regulator transcription factor [Litoribacter alkaliphilus]